MDPFLAEIVMFGGNFAPRGWAYCDGQLLSINAYQALFSLLGTTYGGDGRTTFALPDMRGRTPVHPGTGPGLSTYKLGARGGVETVTLTPNQMPSHTHTATGTGGNESVLMSTDAGIRDTPQAGDVAAGASFGAGLGATKVNAYGPATNTVVSQTLSGGTPTILNNGGSQWHTNIQPYLAVNFIIALQGTFPSRN